MNRLARPWEALRLPMLVTRHTDDTLIANTDMGLVGEILFTRMDTLKNAIQATRHPLFDADILMEQVRNFADLSSGIVKEIALKRDGEWGKRLMGERVDIGKVMEGFNGPRPARGRRRHAGDARQWSPDRRFQPPSRHRKA